MLIVAFFPPFYFRLVVAHVGVESNNENVDHLRCILNIVRGNLTKPKILYKMNLLEKLSSSHSFDESQSIILAKQFV